MKNGLRVGLLVIFGLLAVSPVDAQTEAEIPVTVTIAEILTVQAHDGLELIMEPGSFDTEQVTEYLTVYSNIEAGFSVTVSAAQPLTREDAGMPDTIPAFPGSLVEPVFWDADQIGFGLSLDGGDTFGGVTDQAALIYSGEGLSEREIPVTYRVTVDDSLDAGVYTSTIVYSVTPNI